MPVPGAGKVGRAHSGLKRTVSAVLRRRGSRAEVDSEVPAGAGRWAEFGEAVEPGRLVGARSASQERSVGGEAVIGGSGEVSEFGVEGAQAGGSRGTCARCPTGGVGPDRGGGPRGSLRSGRSWLRPCGCR